ncbi:hypothetical protein A2U01_0069608, partial [Trifolium medium]|nr:hypothetical protein [Trifolium medium]
RRTDVNNNDQKDENIPLAHHQRNADSKVLCPFKHAEHDAMEVLRASASLPVSVSANHVPT